MKTSFYTLALAAIFLVPAQAEKATEPKSNEKLCPISGEAVDPDCKKKYEDNTYTFCCGKCGKKWTKELEATLYHQVGGKAAINAAVDLFYTKVLVDERVNFFFEDINMNKQHNKQKEFLAAALGGPIPWEGKDMRAAHRNLDLNEADFTAIAENLQATLTELEIPEELLGKIMTVVASTKDDVLNN
tara:strand:- start:426 stop:986 length:561 start_codon:yes stop_codon:yes gene_type:complete